VAGAMLIVPILCKIDIPILGQGSAINNIHTTLMEFIDMMSFMNYPKLWKDTAILNL
jgi:hypothetical protein